MDETIRDEELQTPSQTDAPAMADGGARPEAQAEAQAQPAEQMQDVQSEIPADPYAGMTEKEIKKAIRREKKLAKKEKRRKSGWRGFKRGLALGIVLVLLIEICIARAVSGKSEGLNLVKVNTKIKEIESYIKFTHLYDTDLQDIEDGIFAGMMYGLKQDNYAAYYSKKAYAQEQKRLYGSYKGIGVTIKKDDETGGIRIEALNKNGPAYRVGMKVGDIMMEADGQDLTEGDADNAVSIITGELNTQVEIKVLRDGEEMIFVVPRENIVTISVQGKLLDGTKIGYISISTFNQTTVDEFEDVLDQLQELDVEGLVIDLRNNGGGDMNICLDMLDMLLPDQMDPVVMYEGEDTLHPDTGGRTLLLSVEDKSGAAERFYARDKKQVDLPIAAIINARSASASEIFSGTLRDYGHDVIGEHSFGKGIVQSLYTLTDGSAIKLTTHQYRLAGGELIHKKGIDPTIPVAFEEFGEVTAETVNFANGDEEPDLMKDSQIRAAVAAVQKR